MNAKKLFKAADYIATLAPAVGNDWMKHWNTCALGRIAAAGLFKGLTLWVDQETFDTFDTDIEYGGTHHFDAAAKCFGITVGEAVDLFGGYDIEPEQLAADIRAFVRRAQEASHAVAA